MTWDFASYSTVFQLYQDDGEGIMRESLCASELFFNFGLPKMFKVSHNIFVMLQKEHPENEIWIL